MTRGVLDASEERRIRTVTKKTNRRAGETAQQLRAFTAFTEDLGFVSSTHMMTHNHLQLQLQEI